MVTVWSKIQPFPLPIPHWPDLESNTGHPQFSWSLTSAQNNWIVGCPVTIRTQNITKIFI